MGKRTWNPCSKVNQNHLFGMIVKGNSAYHAWLGDIFTAKAKGDVVFVNLVEEGIDFEYITGEQADELLGTNNPAQVAEAAAQNANANMISSLANNSMHDAVQGLIDAGTVTVDQVSTVYSVLELEWPVPAAKPAAKKGATKKA